MVFYRRNLPHLFIRGYSFFVTIRLAGSLPLSKLDELRLEFEKEKTTLERRKNQIKDFETKWEDLKRNYFVKYDSLLDGAKQGPHWLADDRVAALVAESLHWGDVQRYHLIAFTIMPNHIHIVLRPMLDEQHKSDTSQESTKDYFLTEILENFKKYTAHRANKLLGREGAFWQHESYDHMARNKKELLRSVNYTLMNPVKAGLTQTPEEYKWNYVNWDNV
jgi:REP element-mobilizing transposase RayT